MPASITVLKNAHGDLEAHVTGCSDIKRSLSFYGASRPNVSSSATLADAIVAADTKMADWFCETVYTESSRENGCWRITNGVKHAPCFSKALKAECITFDPLSGRPAAQVAAAEPETYLCRLCTGHRTHRADSRIGKAHFA